MTAGPILFVAPQPFYQERGTPIAVLLAVRTLCEAGYQVDLLTLHEGEDVSLPNLRIIRAPRPPLVRHVPIGFSWRKALCDGPLSAALLRLAASRRYAVVHAVEEAIFPALVAARTFGLCAVYDMDSSLADQMMEKWPALSAARAALEGMERLAVRGADVVLPVCQALADKVAAHAPGKPCWVLHDVAFETEDAGAVEDLRAVYGVEGPLALYVGNLESYQGVDLMLEAMAALGPRAPTLLVIGGKPGDVAARRSQADALGLGERVRFLGPRPLANLAGYLRQADLLLSPRLKGVNTPMKIYSYMLSGRAIAATAIVSHTQVLDESCAALGPPEPVGFAAAIARLLEDEALRSRLGAAARARAKERYGYDAYRAKLLEAYAWLERRAAA